jgi:uncharacterized membrane protein
MTYDVHVLTGEVQRLGDPERRVLGHLLQQKPIAQDLNRAFDKQLTLGQRAADWVAGVGGSWPFLFVAVAGISLWVVLNVVSDRPFDAYPFIFLNLVLSCLAALQAPIIIMSQNRQAVKDRLDAQHDYEVNLKAEMEIMALHVKLDELRERQWAELMTSASDGTGPSADSSTTPCLRMNARARREVIATLCCRRSNYR